MIILAAFLAGMAFVIAVAACVGLHQERERARSCERSLHDVLEEQAKILVQLAQQDLTLREEIRAVAAAAVPPTFPADQSKVFISVPGPRTAQ